MDFNKMTKEELIKNIKSYNTRENFLNNVSNLAYFTTDANRVVTYWNQSCEHLYGYKKDEALGKTIESLIIPDYQREYYVEQFTNNEAIYGEELEYQQKDGTLQRVYVNSLFIDNDNHQKEYHHISLNPVKVRKNDALRSLIGHNKSNIENDGAIVIITINKNGYIKEFNKFAEELLGYKKDEVVGRNFIELFVPSSYQEKTLIQIQESFKSKDMRVKSNLPLTCKNGDKKVINWTQSLIYDYKTKTNHMVLVGDYNSTNNNMQDKLEYLANYDNLTDLPNRNLLQNRMINAINRAARTDEKMITMYLNLDNFKSINHTMGYAVGDALLKAVAQRLHSELRDSDTVARFSGDEFVILFEDVKDELDAGVIAKRVSALFDKPFYYKENELFLNINMGISFFPADANDAKSLLKLANMAMQRSKDDKSRNFHFFRAEMFDEINNRAVLESNIRRAIKNREFFVEYQPQVDAKNGKIIGAEALVRWTGPDLKAIPPLDFIPVAEDTGLILEIGQIVLSKAIAQMKEWHDKGYDDLTIAINISGIQLLQSGLVQQIHSILKDTKFNPKFLELELTESILMENFDRASTLLKEFQQKGIQVSIDDFGTGYSSLSYLKQLPIDKIKIDQSFIRNIETDKNDKIIVNTIIAMAHGLEFSVIAEGVEDDYQSDYLKGMKCDYLQGYFYGRSLSPEKFEKLIHENKHISGVEDKEKYDYNFLEALEKYSKPLNI